MPTPRDSGPGVAALDKSALLRNHPLFRELAPPVVERLGAYMTKRTVPRGSVIFAKS